MTNMTFKRKLPVPLDIKFHYMLSNNSTVIKMQRDAEIANIFTGNDNRKVLIIGPCSADNEKAVLDYCERLAKLQDEVYEKFILIPRVYTNKPRTLSMGYKGLLHQPDPEKEEDMLEGIIAMRRLHMDVLSNTGLSTADEMLYPDTYRYVSDLLSYVAVGARSVENQEHRQTASGLDIPVGMKNPISGDLRVMINSIVAAQNSHTFIYRGWEVETNGNLLAHGILRGANIDGLDHPNYQFDNIEWIYSLYPDMGLKTPSLIIDCNHSNSKKRYYEQDRICKEVINSCKYRSGLLDFIKGFMIESYIEDGHTVIGNRVYGKSITDPCLGWTGTEKLVKDIAEMI